MLKVLFGDLAAGRLGRWRFVMYLALIHLLIVVFVLVLGFAAGLSGIVASGDLEAAQNALMSALSLPVLLLSAVFLLAVAFANFNIMAKRLRDMGAPGWIGVLVYVVVRSVLPSVIGTGLTLLVDLVFFLALCFVPTLPEREQATE